MKPTIEQLNELTDYELNCAVAEKLGYVVLKRGMGNDVVIKTMRLARPVNYLDNVNYYMPIAIEHGISCITSKGLDSLWAKCEEENVVSPVYPLHSDFMGRAVCTVFLLMNGESND